MAENRKPIKSRDVLFPHRIFNNLLEDYVSGALTDYSILFKAVVVQVDYVGGQLSGPNTNFPGDWPNPKGSIKARILSKDRYKNDIDLGIFWPFFSHDIMPVKEGEHVYVLFENPNEENRGLWIGRSPEPFQDSQGNPVDNKNLALGTTKYQSVVQNSSIGIDQVVSDTEFQPAAISQSANFTSETVPTFTARVGDRVIEGSNNTIIILGRDRVDQGTTGATEQTANAGTIIIEAGRQTNEVVDLTKDSSIIYVSQNTDPDNNASTQSVGVAASAPSPAIIIKSGELRIVAGTGMKIVVSGGDLTIEGQNINVGNNAQDLATLANALATYLANPAAFIVTSPAGPCTVQAIKDTGTSYSFASQTVKVKP